MNKKIIIGFSLLTTCGMLTGCHLSHDWQDATCTEPRTCLTGGETEGEPLGHTWVEATCSEPKHCSVCGETEGEPLAHTWVDATCSEPKHCSVCGETEGEALAHTWIEANYQQPATCEVCGETEGEPLQADFEKYGLTCYEDLDIPYTYIVPCYSNHEYTTTANVTFSDYEAYTSDDNHEAVDGYEWQAVTMTIVYDDANASDYGWTVGWGVEDYYNLSIYDSYDANNSTFALNFNGIDYPECKYDEEVLENSWSGNVYTYQYRVYQRVPEGYDGMVIAVYNPDNSGDFIYEKADDDSVLFRLK